MTPSLKSKKSVDKGIHIEVDTSNLESQVQKGIIGHQWVQRGPYLFCKSCPIEHSIYIGTELLFVGYDDEGKPKFEKIGARQELCSCPPKDTGVVDPA